MDLPGQDGALELHSKYLLSPGGFKGSFGGLTEFFKGLDSLIGLSNPNVAAAIAQEHSQRPDSYDEFVSNPSTGLSFKPIQEFEFVVNPKMNNYHIYPGTEGAAGGTALNGSRSPKPLQFFLEADICKRADLLEEEVIALRLYTANIMQLFANTHKMWLKASKAISM